MTKLIRISDKNYKNFIRLVGELDICSGRLASVDDAVSFLFALKKALKKSRFKKFMKKVRESSEPRARVPKMRKAFRKKSN